MDLSTPAPHAGGISNPNSDGRGVDVHSASGSGSASGGRAASPLEEFEALADAALL